ncbi:MAG: ABC transporter permease, partial [Clostridia bacterium]
MNRINRYKNEWVLGMIFIALFVVFSVTGQNFLTLTNVMNLFSQMTTLGLITLGMAASLFSGGMDLSIGAICSLCTVLLATFIGTMGMNTVLASLLVLMIALACGAFNGLLIGKFKINSMLVTLGTQSLFTGIGLVASKGITVSIPTDR